MTRVTIHNPTFQALYGDDGVLIDANDSMPAHSAIEIEYEFFAQYEGDGFPTLLDDLVEFGNIISWDGKSAADVASMNAARTGKYDG